MWYYNNSLSVSPHTYLNSDNMININSLKTNIHAKIIRNKYPYSQSTTPITPITPITPKFTNKNKKFIDIQQFRNEISQRTNKRLRLKQAQTDNYYNTTKYVKHIITYILAQNISIIYI